MLPMFVYSSDLVRGAEARMVLNGYVKRISLSTDTMFKFALGKNSPKTKELKHKHKSGPKEYDHNNDMIFNSM